MIVSLINQKGGVGKTTNTIHLGAYLAKLGHKVLLIDLDPQCDLSHGTGVRSYTYDIVSFLTEAPDFRLKQKADNFFILPGNPDFIAAKFKRNDLKNHLQPLVQHFDFIILDSPPANINPVEVTAAELALVACDAFIIPLEAKEYPIKNANAFLKKTFEVKEHYNPGLSFLGFFFSNVLVTRKNIKEYTDLLKEHAKDLLFDTFIRTDSKVEMAIKDGKTIFQYDPSCRASLDYINFTHEFLNRSNYGKK
jgi:chromosome partitioning protein